MLKAAVIIFFTCALGAFIYLFVRNVDFTEFFSSVKELFQDLAEGFKQMYEEHLERKAQRKEERIQRIEEERIQREKERKQREEERRQRTPGISPERVIALRNQRKGFTGIYIIYNYSKNMYYVGQAQNVLVRCSNHFLGKGNADIYADYKYGDEFFIEFVSLVESGYDNLDDLERYYINRYDAVRRGYNKKKGNR